jgi:hypothetical protein
MLVPVRAPVGQSGQSAPCRHTHLGTAETLFFVRGLSTERLIAIFLTPFFAGSAAADDRKEYENRDYSFIHFPRDPAVEIATYFA